MSKHCTTLLVAVGLALVLGDSARAAISGPSATAEKPARHKTTLNDPLFDPQIGRTFRDNTGA
jgi:hypothetical protein